MVHMDTPAPEHITHHQSVKKQVFIPLAIFIVLLFITTIIVLFGRGYRLFFQKGEPVVGNTGLLNVASTPKGSQVYVDGHLTTATDNTINLTPGKYTIKISKDGYADWQKDVQIVKEVVTNIDATLYPIAPTLQSISTYGVESALIDPSGTKLAFKIASQSSQLKNGIYIFDMTSRSFPVLAGQSSSTQIVNDTTDAFSTADLSWSPDGKQLLASITGSANGPTYYLLSADGFNSNPQDVTAILSSITQSWQTQKQAAATASLKSLKPEVSQFVVDNMHILAWSTDGSKILYQASQSATMPIFLKPRRIGNNLLYEQRTLEKGSVYVYDRAEDINTRIVQEQPDLCADPNTECTTPFMWFSDSYHLLYVHQNKIDIIEWDGANQTTIYAGPFVDHYVYPWPDGSKLVILTNLSNQDVSPTLYTIGLK